MENHISPTTTQLQGKEAKTHIETGTTIIGNIAKSILGPTGSLKLLQHPDNNISITNDGATILKNLKIDHPTARLLIEGSVNQDWEEGDGTTSVAILSHYILKNCNAYGKEIASSAIIKGLEIVLQRALNIIERVSTPMTDEMLYNLAYTTLNSKNMGSDVGRFAKMCVEAVNRISCSCYNTSNLEIYGKESVDFHLLGHKSTKKESNKLPETEKVNEKASNKIKKACECINDIDLNSIRIVKLPGTVSKSFLCTGLIIKNMNVVERIEKPCVFVVNTNLDHIKVKMTSTKVSVSSIKDVVEIENREIARVVERVGQIVKYNQNSENSKKIDFLVNRQIVYDLPRRKLKDAGIEVIENVGFDAIEQISKITDTPVISSFESVSNNFKFGSCQSIDSIRINDTRFTRFLSGSPDCAESESNKKTGSACSIVLFGPSDTIRNETERSVHDALCVLSRVKQERKLLFGGGAIELTLARELLKAVSSDPVDAICTKIFCESLIEIPRTLIENSGGKPDQILVKLKQIQEKNNAVGVNVNGRALSVSSKLEDALIGDMKSQGVFESCRVKSRVLCAAVEIAQMLVKCDSIILNGPRQRNVV